MANSSRPGLQKALEQRDDMLRSLQVSLSQGLSAGEYERLHRRTADDIVKSIAISDFNPGEDEAFVKIPDSYGMAKEFFLSALFDAVKSYSVLDSRLLIAHMRLRESQTNETPPDAVDPPVATAKLLAGLAALELIPIYFERANKLAETRQEFAAAKDVYRLALARARDIGYTLYLIMALRYLAMCELMLGEKEEARRDIAEASELTDGELRQAESAHDIKLFQTLRQDCADVQDLIA